MSDFGFIDEPSVSSDDDGSSSGVQLIFDPPVESTPNALLSEGTLLFVPRMAIAYVSCTVHQGPRDRKWKSMNEYHNNIHAYPLAMVPLHSLNVSSVPLTKRF